MNLIDYLEEYQDVSFKEMPFNEIDALALADFSYVDFTELGVDKERISGEDLVEFIDQYEPTANDSQRKLNYLKVAKLICESERFDKVEFAHFRKVKDWNSDKQFQAVTILFKDIMYISFCGTDATVVGWKEDFNMAILDMVPSEIEAIKYINMVAMKHWFRKIYVGGHSKGGRLAITAAKGMDYKRRIAAIFSFDSPNYPSNFYDANYKKIDSLILAYAPNESIIGRLMNEYHQKRIIKSTNNLLMQHDTFSWIIEGNSFIYDSDYTEKSTRIVSTINHCLTNNDEETKHQFIDTLFDYFERLNIEKLPNEKDFVGFFVGKIPTLVSEWKNTSKESRSVVKKIVFELLKDYFTSK